MKKLVLALLISLVMATSAFAVGTASVTSVERIKVLGEFQHTVVTITWTDDTAGTTLAINPTTYGIMGWYLVQAETNPGATAPTINYGITLVSTSGLDLAVGSLLNRSDTATERVAVSGMKLIYPMVFEGFTFTLSGNAVNNATGTLKLIFAPN